MTSIHSWNDFIYQKSLSYTSKLLELINEFIKVLGFKVNKQEIVVYQLYFN